MELFRLDGSNGVFRWNVLAPPCRYRATRYIILVASPAVLPGIYVKLECLNVPPHYILPDPSNNIPCLDPITVFSLRLSTLRNSRQPFNGPDHGHTSLPFPFINGLCRLSQSLFLIRRYLLYILIFFTLFPLIIFVPSNVRRKSFYRFG